MLSNKGQNLVEIVTIFAIASLALVAMQIYVRRGIQGKAKYLTDNIINPQGLAQKAYVSSWEKSTTISKTLQPSVTTVETAKSGAITKTVDEKTYSYVNSSSLSE